MLIRPRLTDYHGVHLSQTDIDFVIPFVNEDIPLYVDPFLLWMSPSQQDNSLHNSLVNSFNNLGFLMNSGKKDMAIETLIISSECDEVGLGYSQTRKGLRIGKSTAEKVLNLFKKIPTVKKNGFTHIETAQLFVDQIAKDRISDMSCSFLKSFLIDYTIEQCEKYEIPLTDVEINNVYNQRTNKFLEKEASKLPINPETQQPIIFVPKRWLRKNNWISTENYFYDYLPKEVFAANEQHIDKGEILNYNRANYGIVENYIKYQEVNARDCKNDPLFTPLPVLSVKRKCASIVKLPSGKENKADINYENWIGELFATLLYPHLDFAKLQSRTDSGVLIRDLIFYNNRSIEFWNDIYSTYQCQQIVFEMKNVKEVNRDHINQLNRYMGNEIGNFGIIVTRNELPKKIFKNTIDLWSGQRKCIIALTDEDVKLMVDIYESKQRIPYEVIKRRYLEFKRACPG